MTRAERRQKKASKTKERRNILPQQEEAALFVRSLFPDQIDFPDEYEETKTRDR